METKQGYFDPKMPRHLDDRFYKATVVDILAIPEGARFKGMEIFAYDEGEWWQFKEGVLDVNLVPSERGASVTAESYSWTWADGVDVGGTHLNFVILGAQEDEIGDISSCILFVGGSLQVGNFTIEDTNVARDTVQIPGTAAEREGTVEVALFYNRAGQALPPTQFTDLTDTPNSYTGEKIRTVKVNDAESGVEFGYGLWKGTQVEYDALGQPQKDDVNIIHFIVEP